MSREVVDGAGERLALARPASRVVSLVPSLTETVFLLGRGEAVVGRTPFCVEPVGALGRARSVGGPRGLEAARVLALGPDLVLACREENVRGEVEALRRAGLAVYVASVRRVSEVAGLLRDLGLLLGVEGRARLAAEAVEEAVRAAEARPRGRRPRVTCPVWLEPARVVGLETYAADLVRLAGGSIEPPLAGYPALPAGLAPEVVLLPDEPYRFGLDDLARLGLDRTPAARSGRVHLADGKLLFWYGPRSAAAVGELAALIG